MQANVLAEPTGRSKIPDGTAVPLESVSPPDEPDAADYRPSHRGILIDITRTHSPLTPSGLASEAIWGPTLGSTVTGGILLPTSRSFDDGLPGVALAVELALDHRCPLIVICSRAARVGQFPEIYRDKLGELLILLNLDDVDPAWLPALDSSKDKISKLRRPNDVGSKRNIGLAMAVHFGWKYLMFMDDDIGATKTGPTLNADHLAHALAMLQENDSLKAIGWTLEDYDDNSVVGHARPFADLPQGIFIGGGALLVRCEQEMPFFPDIYNEDWLFLIALAAGAPNYRKALGWGGSVHQRSYAPFRVRRARSEEAGEIVGECLMNLLEDHGPGYERGLTPGYWRRALLSRWRLLQLIKERVRQQPEGRFAGQERLIRGLLDSMTAAQETHRELKPMDLLHFVRLWRSDEQVWHTHLRTLAPSPLHAPHQPRAEALTSPPGLAHILRESA